MNTTSSSPNLGRFGAAPFILAGLCFLMPFLTISCKEDPKLMRATLTGVQLVTGTQIEVKSALGESPKTEHVRADARAILALACAVAGALMGLRKDKVNRGLMVAAAVGGLAFLWLLKTEASHPSRPSPGESGSSGLLTGRSDDAAMEAFFEVKTELGFTLACLAFASGALLNGYLLRRAGAVGQPAVVALPPAELPGHPTKPPATQPDGSSPGPIENDTTGTGRPRQPSLPPKPPPPPPPKKRRVFKWAVLILSAAAAYAVYPYCVAYSLARAVKNGRREVLATRIDFAAVKKILPNELASRMNIKDQTNKRPAPALADLTREAFLQQFLGKYLEDADGFLRLMRPISSNEPREGTERARPSLGFLRQEEPKLSVRRAGFGSFGRTFFNSVSEFCVTLRDVTLELQLVTSDYASDQPWELQLTIPSAQLFLELTEETWRLKRVAVPQDIQGLAFIPFIDEDELMGGWRIEGKPELELDITPESGSSFAQFYRLDPDGSLAAITLRRAQNSANQIRFQYSAARRQGQAVITKDRQGRHTFEVDNEKPGSLVKGEVALALSELNGIWKPAGGGLQKVELYEDGHAGLSGMAVSTEAARSTESILKNSRVSGRTVELDMERDRYRGTTRCSILKRTDGALFVTVNADSANEHRYHRLDKIGEPPPPIAPEELEGKWETDTLNFVEIVASRRTLGRATFNPRGTDPRAVGVINASAAGRRAIPLKWTYLLANGTGSLGRPDDGQWSIKFELNPSHSFNPLQEANLRRLFADGEWHVLRPYQPPASTPPKLKTETRTAPTSYSLTVRSTGFPADSTCEITLRADNQLLPVKGGPESSRQFAAGCVIELEAPPEVGGCAFDRWAGPADSIQGTKAWITNTFARTLVAHYKGWQGVWKTSRRDVLNLTQDGNDVTAKSQTGSVRLNGRVEMRNNREYLRATLLDVFTYDIGVTLSEDCKSFAGTIQRREGTGVRQTSVPEDFSAQRVP